MRPRRLDGHRSHTSRNGYDFPRGLRRPQPLAAANRQQALRVSEWALQKCAPTDVRQRPRD